MSKFNRNQTGAPCQNGSRTMPFTLKLRMLSSAIMSLLLAALMTAWVTWLNVGFAPDFLARWGHAYVCAWPAAFVIVMLIGPTVQRLALHLLQNQPGHPRHQAAAAAQPASKPQ